MDGLTDIQEIIPGRLCLASTHRKPKSTHKRVFFNIDDELVYQPFYADFGPLNLSLLHRYCAKVNHLLQEFPHQEIIHYTSYDVHKRANAVYLIASYSIVHLGKTAEEAARPFLALSPPLMPFRDASYGACTFKLTLHDCLAGLSKALQFKFYDPSTFDVAEYEHYERVENGDLNWIVPGKFVAFAGPHSTTVSPTGYPLHTPDHYFDYFKKTNVTDIIRLNVKLYDADQFRKAGFSHHELYFDDGTTPTDAILNRFLEICENAKGAIAVHCKAGLGRTGTLICSYIMKHYGLTHNEAIGWNRIARPGSVIGPQQQYLRDKEAILHAMGNETPVLARKENSPLTLNEATKEIAHGVGSISLDPNPILNAKMKHELTTMTQGDLLNEKKAMRTRTRSSQQQSLFSGLLSKAKGTSH